MKMEKRIKRLDTDCERIDITVESDKDYEVYGLWYRNDVLELKSGEEISILGNKLPRRER